MAIKCPKYDAENSDMARFCSHCASSLKDSEDSLTLTQPIGIPRDELTTGSTFAGRYRIIESIGYGGMGKVYKVKDEGIDEIVAIKLIKPEISSDKEMIKRFQNELKFARKIRHQNVCQMYDLNKHKGTYFITMEYVPGQELKALIKQSGRLGARGRYP